MQLQLSLSMSVQAPGLSYCFSICHDGESLVWQWLHITIQDSRDAQSHQGGLSWPAEMCSNSLHKQACKPMLLLHPVLLWVSEVPYVGVVRIRTAGKRLVNVSHLAVQLSMYMSRSTGVKASQTLFSAKQVVEQEGGLLCSDRFHADAVQEGCVGHFSAKLL